MPKNKGYQGALDSVYNFIFTNANKKPGRLKPTKPTKLASNSDELASAFGELIGKPWLYAADGVIGNVNASLFGQSWFKVVGKDPGSYKYGNIPSDAGEIELKTKDIGAFIKNPGAMVDKVFDGIKAEQALNKTWGYQTGRALDQAITMLWAWGVGMSAADGWNLGNSARLAVGGPTRQSAQSYAVKAATFDYLKAHLPEVQARLGKKISLEQIDRMADQVLKASNATSDLRRAKVGGLSAVLPAGEIEKGAQQYKTYLERDAKLKELQQQKNSATDAAEKARLDVEIASTKRSIEGILQSPEFRRYDGYLSSMKGVAVAKRRADQKPDDIKLPQLVEVANKELERYKTTEKQFIAELTKIGITDPNAQQEVIAGIYNRSKQNNFFSQSDEAGALMYRAQLSEYYQTRRELLDHAILNSAALGLSEKDVKRMLVERQNSVAAANMADAFQRLKGGTSSVSGPGSFDFDSIVSKIDAQIESATRAGKSDLMAKLFAQKTKVIEAQKGHNSRTDLIWGKIPRIRTGLPARMPSSHDKVNDPTLEKLGFIRSYDAGRSALSQMYQYDTGYQRKAVIAELDAQRLYWKSKLPSTIDSADKGHCHRKRSFRPSS